MEREQVFKEMHGYRELDREMSGLVPRSTNLGVTDAIVSELFSTARNQFRDFAPRDEPVPKDQKNVSLTPYILVMLVNLPRQRACLRGRRLCYSCTKEPLSAKLYLVRKCFLTS